MQLKCYYKTNCMLRAKLREEAAGGCLRKFQLFLALDCPTNSKKKKEEFIFNGSKQCSFKYHLTSQGMSPAVPFQVCPVPAVRACYRRCVIGVCICVINVQEKGILQNERLLFIISLKKENLHSLLNVQNAQHPNQNISKIASIKQKNQEGEDKTVSHVKTRNIYYFTRQILWKNWFPEFTTITEVGWRESYSTNPSSPAIIYSIKTSTDL